VILLRLHPLNSQVHIISTQHGRENLTKRVVLQGSKSIVYHTLEIAVDPGRQVIIIELMYSNTRMENFFSVCCFFRVHHDSTDCLASVHPQQLRVQLNPSELFGYSDPGKGGEENVGFGVICNLRH